jgi:hypothetical protein
LQTKLQHILTSTRKAEMVAYIKTEPGAFEEAIHLALTGEQPYSWRAAWVLWACMEESDPRIKPHLKSFIELLPQKSYNEQREFLIILQRMDISGDDEGRLFDTCVRIWEKLGLQASVRHNALKMMAKIAKKHPELKQELKLLTEPHYLDSLSDGVRRSVARILSVK